MNMVIVWMFLFVMNMIQNELFKIYYYMNNPDGQCDSDVFISFIIKRNQNNHFTILGEY